MSEINLSFDQLLARLISAMPLAPDKPEETHEATARTLWLTAAGTPCAVSSAVQQLPALDVAQVAVLNDLLRRRLSGEPLAYITGRQEFLGVELLALPGALIPRVETHIVGREALRQLADIASRVAQPQVLDLCTGSGNLAVVMAKQCPTAHVYAADLEHAALEVAQRNAEYQNVEQRLQLLQGDLFGALASSAVRRFHLITCNPPYLTTRHAQNMPREIGAAEPVAAFDGGPFGVSITLRLIREAPDFLLPGGWLCFELGAGQGEMLEKRLRSNSAYVEFRALTDAQDVVRALCARIADAPA